MPAVAESPAIASGYWAHARARVRGAARQPTRARGRPRRSRRCRRSVARPAAVADRGAPRPAGAARPLHRRPVHARGAGAPRPAADPLPRPDPGRVRPRRLGDRGDDPLRDHRGRSPSPRPRPRRSATSRPSSSSAIPSGLAELEGRARASSPATSTTPTRAAPWSTLEDVEAAHDAATADRRGDLPEEWQESSDEADFDLVQISLDQMEAAVSAGEPQSGRAGAADRLRLLRVRAGDQAARVRPRARARGRGADLVRRRRPGRPRRADRRRAPAISEIRETRLVLDEALEDAPGEDRRGRSATTVITNSALIVFREGLEAILIIAAIDRQPASASKRPLRKPILRGAAARRPGQRSRSSSSRCWCSTRSPSTARSSRRSSASSPIGVLLLVLNWFFHKVYWTEWIKGHRERSKELLAEGAGAAAGAAGRSLGLYMLGFTSVFREGFETVPLPAGAAAQLGHRDRPRRRLARPARDRGRRRRRPSSSSASSPTRAC